MFSKLALRNIRRSLKDYAIYFFTLALGVAIFYVFNALESQSVMLGLSDYMLEIVKLMNGVMSGVSVFVALVLGFLIIYASRFLIKRRSQEFGTYMMLGMSKRRISMIILLETMIIGVVSLAAGLLVGVVFSQFTSALVANMFEADMTEYRFVFSSAAAVKTLVYFAIIFLIVMLLDTFIIAKQRLIKLLQARKVTEKVKIRKTWLAMVVLAIGVTMLVWAYSMATVNVSQLDEDNILPVLVAGALGTTLFFWSIATIVLKVLSKTSFYNRGLNTFTLRQFSSAINTSVVAMTMICLMLFVTICVSVSAISMHESIMASVEEAMPIDIEYMSEMSDGTRMVDLLKGEYNVDLSELLTEQSEYELIYQYGDDLTYRTILGEVASRLDDSVFAYNTIIPAMRVGDYNAISDLFGNEKVELSDNQYAIVANFPTMVELYEKSLALDTEIKLGNQALRPASDKVIDGQFQMSSTANSNTGLLIIPDNLKIADAKTQRYAVGNFKDGLDVASLTDKILKIRDEEMQKSQHYLAIETKQALLDSNIGVNAIVTFVALYLGIIFLIASAALLALKQLTESSDNREKYTILQKLGTSGQMINRALGVQIGIFFALPLVVAIIHAVFGVMFCDYVLSFFGGVQIGGAVIGTGLIFVVIYGGYFWITYAGSRRMIGERKP